MPNFVYRAISNDGRTIENEIVAQNENDVIRHLQKLQLMPVKIKEQASKAVKKLNQRSIKTKDMLLFTKQLYTLLKSGVPILVSLNAIKEQTEEPSFKGMVETIAREVESGNPFSAALGQFNKVFPTIYVNSVKVGEMSGTLEDTLLYLYNYIEEETRMRKNVTKALRYPALVVSGLVAAFVVFTTFVIPNFIPLFLKSGVELPLPTRILIGMNSVIMNYGVLILIALAGIIVGLIFYVRTTEGRYNFHLFLLKLPVIGGLLSKVSIARFAKVFYTMNHTGIPVLKALETMEETMDNEVYRREIVSISERIKEGEGIANSLRKSDYFSNFSAEMIAIGEKSGALDEMLDSISQYYDMEINEAVENMTSLIEPLMTVVLGGFVLLFALAIFLPMWDMMSLAH